MTEFLANFLRLQIQAHQKALDSLNGALQVMVDSFGPNIGSPTEQLISEIEKRRQNAQLH